MSDDFLEKMQQESRNRWGAELTPEQAAERFALHNFEARVQHLGNLRRDSDMPFNDAAKRFRYERALRDVHEKLRRVGR
jgi:hypothetical protein